MDIYYHLILNRVMSKKKKNLLNLVSLVSLFSK